MDRSWGYGTEQRLREENQDCYGVFELPDFTLAIVCDGMGGHVGGAQASSLAVRTIHDALMELHGKPILQSLEQAIERTNLVIYEAARKNHRLMGMGTTAAVAAITNDACYIAHVGDSRVYLLRRGQVQQLTRDHTMVNLFVDAELLSPEDAATHPEAHVLSRSLGVERQVDVELASPIQLEPGDVIFLCSDGVHGVVTDWELANVEWGAPHAGVSHVLNIVGTREGDDNATATAVLMGTSFEDVPPSPLPEPRRFDDVAPPSGGITAVPEEGQDHGNTFGSDSGFVVYEENPQFEPPSHEMMQHHPMVDEEVREPPPPPPPPPRSQPPPQRTPPPPPFAPQASAQPNRSRALLAIIPVLLALFMLLLALMGAVLLFLPASDQQAELLEPEPGGLAGVVAAPDPPSQPSTPAVEPGGLAQDARNPTPLPRLSSELPEVVQAPEPILPLFDATELPRPPRRLPHRATRYTQPPPGGQLQFQAVSAARRRDCPAALDAVQEGMKISIDHATLYRGAWLCFNEAHQRKLEQNVAHSWSDFAYRLPHFEGTPEKKEAVEKTNSKIARLPPWFRPAVGGLEYRLEAFTNDPNMEEVMADLFSEARVADQLAKDLHMEALAAYGLSQLPLEERSKPAIEAAWARRVYILAWSLERRPGRLLDKHRRELLPTLRDLLDKATSPVQDERGRDVRVPEQVTYALDVAQGNRDEPKPRSTAPPRRDPTIDEIERQIRENADDVIVYD